jgi:hypothetical protein
MTDDQIYASIEPYAAELSNIKYFLRERRTIFEWQDWLHKKMPKLARQTTKVPPSARVLTTSTNLAVRYTDLLTLLCKCGRVERVREPHMTHYKWIDV